MVSPTPLKVPEMQAGSGTFTDRSPGGIADWLEQLPRGNPDACATAVLNALHDSNRSPLRKSSRYRVAELMRPVVNDVSEALVRQYRNAALPLNGSEEQRAGMVQQLYNELTIAFRHAVNGALANRPAGGDPRRHLLVATQRALLAQGRALLEAYRVHAPEPQGFWRTLHTLYANAEALRLQALPIEGEPDSDETALSVKQAYLRIVILALANPYHLMQGEAEELYRRIGRWAHFTRLDQTGPGTPLAGRFVVDLDSDFPPRYLAQQQRRQLPLAEPRVLDLEQLVSTLDGQVARLDDELRRSRHSGALSLRMQRNMYLRFQNALGGRQERTTARHSTMARVTLVDGLVRCHYVLNGQRPFLPEADELRWRRKLAEASRGREGLELAGDEWIQHPGNAGRRNAEFRAFDAEADDIWARAHRVEVEAADDDTGEPEAIAGVTFSRKNASSGGMALFQPRECPLRTRVGELVAYSEPGAGQEPGQWRLATIRWLRTRPERGLELGVEFLADDGHAAASKAESGPGAGSDYLRTLIVPRVNPLAAAATLITPANVYDVGTRLALNLGELVIHVQLTETVESTRHYTQFRYQPVTGG
ncbi:hypothetical protein QWY84_03735 [Aquisalimonas lutea]|uniref:hypothetical protein n=1 Tax=Aquisalimonas lutea TaxID=1327750 RepID=UPI0025B4EFB9|nr:hypothetical protein [Aquisalimonas lutea]MDN3516716.1 hypothetical protein [Aquisalimonas lutea]